jgi:hypothetical protein
MYILFYRRNYHYCQHTYQVSATFCTQTATRKATRIARGVGVQQTMVVHPNMAAAGPPRQPTTMPGNNQGEPVANMMKSTGAVLLHHFISTLQEWHEKGAPVDCGYPWSMEVIDAALARGNHMLATMKEAVMLIWNAVDYQVKAKLMCLKNGISSRTPPELEDISGRGHLLC